MEVLEICDLAAYLQTVTEEVRQKMAEIRGFFEISHASPSDPIAGKPDQKQLLWSAKVAAAQERMVSDKNPVCDLLIR